MSSSPEATSLIVQPLLPLLGVVIGGTLTVLGSVVSQSYVRRKEAFAMQVTAFAEFANAGEEFLIWTNSTEVHRRRMRSKQNSTEVDNAELNRLTTLRNESNERFHAAKWKLIVHLQSADSREQVFECFRQVIELSPPAGQWTIANNSEIENVNIENTKLFLKDWVVKHLPIWHELSLIGKILGKGD